VQPENILDDLVKTDIETYAYDDDMKLSEMRHIWENWRKFIPYYLANPHVVRRHI
jgi:hypothetical protein